jgi:hypothetical protein
MGNMVTKNIKKKIEMKGRLLRTERLEKGLPTELVLT